MKSLQVVIVLMLLTSFVACNNMGKKSCNHDHDAEHNKNEYAHWGYDGDEGPDKWDKLCPAYSECKGNHQSPIDISSNLSTSKDVNIKQSYSYVSGVDFVNNGHSIQVNFNEEQSNILMVNDNEYLLKQFHFHCPSEHTIDGKELAGEAHFVHVDAVGHISVLGVFIEEGEENDFLERLIHHLPKKEGETTRVDEVICAQSAFSKHDEFYVYEGSLTTPPCTEGVNWFIRKEHIQATHAQLEALHKAMPDHNNRPIQPINDRKFGHLSHF